MRNIIVLPFLSLVFIAGCATLDATLSVVELFTPEIKPKPVQLPVCNADNLGTVIDWKECLEFTDGSFRWHYIEIHDYGYGGMFSADGKNPN